jgi:hypothetical protein
LKIVGGSIISTKAAQDLKLVSTGNVHLGGISQLKIDGGQHNYVLYTDGSGNLNFGNISTAIGANLTIANVIATIYGNVLSTSANLGNLYVANSTITSNYSDIHLVPSPIDSLNSVYVDSVGSIVPPRGNTVQRPVGVPYGSLRYNSDNAALELYYPTGWFPITSTVTSQNIYPDGISQTYTLNAEATSQGVIVTINGTVQQPDVAYTVVGNYITFSEVLLVSDNVNVRFIGGANFVSATLNTGIVTTPNVAASTSTITLDTFAVSMYRSAKYTVQASTPNNGFETSEIICVHNGTTATINTFGVVYTGSNQVINYSATLSSGNVQVQATGLFPNMQLRVQKTYFII